MKLHERVFNIYEDNELQNDNFDYGSVIDYLVEAFNSKGVNREELDKEIEYVDKLNIGDREELYCNESLLCEIERIL